MSRNIKKQLKELQQVAPDKKWKERQRDILLAQIGNMVVEKKNKVTFREYVSNIFEILAPSGSLAQSWRPLGAMILVVIVAFSGGIATVGAAMDSVPGHPLYTVKRAAEQVRLTFAPNEVDKAKLQLKFARNRLEEVKKISKSEEKTAQRSAKIKIAITSMKEGLDTIGEHIGKAVKNEDTSGKEIMEAVKEIDNKTEELKTTLEETKDKLANVQDDSLGGGKNNENNKEAAQAVEDALDSANSAAMETLRIIIFKENTEKVVISDKDISERLKEELARLETNIKETTDQLKLLSGQKSSGEKIDYALLSSSLKSLKDKLDESAIAVNIIYKKLENKKFKEVFNDIKYHQDALKEIRSGLEAEDLKKKKEEQAEQTVKQEEVGVPAESEAVKEKEGDSPKETKIKEEVIGEVNIESKKIEIKKEADNK